VLCYGGGGAVLWCWCCGDIGGAAVVPMVRCDSIVMLLYGSVGALV
jgi:hypothetical protein